MTHRSTDIRHAGSAITLVLVTLGLLVVLAVLLVWLGGGFGDKVSRRELVVYCAAGLKPPVEETARRYEREFGVPVRLQYASSGALLNQIEVDPRGDLYIPAADDPFLRIGREKGMIAEIIPLAQFRLVIATRPGNPKNIRRLGDLLRDDVGFAIANEQAAVGKLTKSLLTRSGHWETIKGRAKVFKPTVTEVALDVKVGVGVDAGFVWDSTTKQFGLDLVMVPELGDGTSNISACVLANCTEPSAALRFARYLAAPERGQQAFAKHHYQPRQGDPWVVTPSIRLFSGGVNREAIKNTLASFEQREGCRITSVYHGCGTLVGMMKTGQRPDAYFACDVSYIREVNDLFLDATDISKTDMVILVRKGNPKNIARLEDLAMPGLEVGLADERLSALGALSRRLLVELGLYEAVLTNRRATTPTADLLVTQLIGGDPLDAVVVYEANCSYVGDQAEIVRIDHPLASAVQPFAIATQTKYPQLTARLLDALTTPASRRRFKSVGFRWLADHQEP